MELWNSLYTYLTASFDFGFDRAFLKRIKFKEYVNDTIIVLSAEDSFARGWFQANCIPILQDHLHKQNLKKEFRIEIAKEKSISTDNVSYTSLDKTSNKKHTSNLSLQHTFDYFIEGCNDFAFNAARLVVEDHSSKYNPLIIVGSIGTGKTHLAQAIAHKFHTTSPNSLVHYTTSEDFTNEFIEHLQKKTMNKFRDKYRKCDLFIIDDIQGLQTRESTTEELENIFNTLISHGKQMVFTSDRPIKKLKDLNPRLKARLSGGLTVDLKNPDFETRKAVLLNMCQRENHKVDHKVIDLIAETIDQNIRELKSTLLKLFAYADLKKKDISLKLAKEVLSDKIQIDIPSDLSVQEIQKKVAAYFGIKTSDIKSASKLSSKAHPRKIAMYLASKYTPHTSTEIGSLFSKSHSTVIRSTQKIEAELPKNTNLKKDIDKILLEISEAHH